MTLLRRRPREVYRVYTEEEYLNGAGSEPAPALADEWPVAVEPARSRAGERRLGRVAGMALLAGAVATVGGVVAANKPWAHRGAGRRPESLVAVARASRVVHSPVITGSYAAPSRSVVVPAAKTTRSRAARAGHWASDSHLPRTRLPTRPRGGVAAVVNYVPEAPAGGITAPRPSADETTTSEATAPVSSADGAPAPAATASAATARAGAGSRAEFGFER